MRSIDAYIKELFQTCEGLHIITDPGSCEEYIIKNYSRSAIGAP